MAPSYDNLDSEDGYDSEIEEIDFSGKCNCSHISVRQETTNTNLLLRSPRTI